MMMETIRRFIATGRRTKWISNFSLSVALCSVGLYGFLVTGFFREYNQPVWDFAQYYTAGRLWLEFNNQA